MTHLLINFVANFLNNKFKTHKYVRIFRLDDLVELTSC